jgi:predicted amidohydrolase
MNLRFVEAFHWAVSQGSVTRAAQELHITQSALSARISALEEELGTVRVDRRDKQFRLAIAGQRFHMLAHQQLSMQRQIKEAMGHNSSSKVTVRISAICLHPDGSGAIYRKRFLHAGEEWFASPGEISSQCLKVGDQRVSLAICADTGHAEHPRRARDLGATVYASNVLWSYAGCATDASIMQNLATEHGMAMLVANHGAPTGRFAAAGRSVLWDPGRATPC